MDSNFPEGYIDDDELYKMYPQHRKWFNKLWLAEQLGYNCGPAGIAPDEDGTYVVRPIMNLAGMGIGAEVKEIKAGDKNQVPAGYFWCEYLTGKHYSGTYEFVHDVKPYWKPISCWEGVNMPINLTKFVEWKRSDYIPEVPRELNVLCEVPKINVEFKGNSPIEVHLRDSPNPKYDHLVPTWKLDDPNKHQHLELHGYTWIEAYSDGNGELENPRTGFWVK